MEIWKDVKGYEGAYQVSSFGRVRSLDRKVPSKYGKFRKVKGMILKQGADKDGYKKVNLKKSQKGKSSRVHRLVAEAFINNPENKPQVNHINGIKNDNRLLNLEWATLSENRQHAYDTGLQGSESRKGTKSNFNKLTEEQVLAIRKAAEHQNITQKKLAKVYNVTTGCIQSVISKKSWAWL